MSKRTVHTPAGFTYTYTQTPEPKRKETKQVSITTLDRRLQVIRKWQREGLITAAKAKTLTAKV